MDVLLLLLKSAYKVIQSVLISISLSLLIITYIVFYTNTPTDMFNKLRIPEQIKKADVIVVLGAGVTEHAWPDRYSMERTIKGVILYKKGLAKKMIFSGGWEHDGYVPPAIAMAKIAKELGVKQEDIFIEDKSKDTYENALNTALIMKYKKYKTAILVTSDSHMRRSMAVFTKLKVPVYPAPVEERLVTNEIGWKPKFHNFNILYQFVYESFGMIKYQNNGWI